MKYLVGHVPKAPAVEVRSMRDRGGNQPTTKNSARRPLFVAAATICLPYLQRSTRNWLAIKKRIEPPLPNGYPYDPGGYLDANGVKWNVVIRPPTVRLEDCTAVITLPEVV